MGPDSILCVRNIRISDENVKDGLVLPDYYNPIGVLAEMSILFLVLNFLVAGNFRWAVIYVWASEGTRNRIILFAGYRCRTFMPNVVPFKMNGDHLGQTACAS